MPEKDLSLPQSHVLSATEASPPLLMVPLSLGPAPDQGPPLDLPARPKLDAPEEIRRRAMLSQQPEVVLTALMDECHFLMREVALRCIVHSPGVEDRLAFMKSAMACAETGATVAKALAKLRAIPLSEEQGIAILLEADKFLERGKKAESEKQ